MENLVYDDDEDEDADDEEDDDEECYATTCPTCEQTIYFDDSILDEGEVICPNCGEKLEFDVSDVEDDTTDGDQE